VRIESPPRAILAWTALAAVVALAFVEAAFSEQLRWRRPVYIAAGFAGVAALAIVLLQPLLAGGFLPGLAGPRGRRVHRMAGAALVAAVIIHVGGLWITSPPDVIDALLFDSPTPFSAWGVIAMAAVFLSGALALARKRLRLGVWRAAHAALALVIVTGAVVHTLLIDGTMGTVSKWLLCGLAVAATVAALARLRGQAALRR
jgi:hypothetical protein